MITDKINVMVVDDEGDFRQLMSVWLESKGYAVTLAPDGQTAIDLIKKSRPDIVFLDLNMPALSGVDTLKQIRKFEKTLPVIIISAYLDKMNPRETAPYKISGVFYKGEDFEKGIALLETALAAHKKLKK